jgi:hypothetical protein
VRGVVEQIRESTHQPGVDEGAAVAQDSERPDTVDQ